MFRFQERREAASLPPSGGLIAIRNQWCGNHPAARRAALQRRAAMIAQSAETILPDDDRAEHRAVAHEQASQLHSARIYSTLGIGNAAPGKGAGERQD